MSSQATGSVLRLSPVAPTEAEGVEPKPWEGTIYQDGPMVPHPSFLRENPLYNHTSYATDITKKEYRAQWKEKQEKLYEHIRTQQKSEETWAPEIVAIDVTWPPVNMTQRNGRTDEDLESALEKYYAGAKQYSFFFSLAAELS
ncbi:hypothetical protein N7528_008981 [Penicillium herquei]|nr:hypothetical protein N7528_008981 [Penicillium herquei]